MRAFRLPSREGTRRPNPHRRATAAFVAGVCAIAGATHYFREVREHQLVHARHLVWEGRFEEALETASTADRWPSTARPGRVDLVRARALEGLGDLDAAIASYRRAVEADPTNFRALAGLAAACAKSADSARWSLAVSLRSRLSHEFGGHPGLAGALRRIDLLLLQRQRTG